MMRQKEERTWFDEKDILHHTTFLLHLSIVFILIWCTYTSKLKHIKKVHWMYLLMEMKIIGNIIQI